ncbi:MAG: YicC family protein [Halobacteriovoraceae bacterium]|jgi:uncharacterized protein (TIGR00255 family)|nr:YicC family protein [Halobacteriovoraceae bacterium]
MTIQSMTGFGKGELENDNFSLAVEIKSVNHRFKDMRFKMGSTFNAHEIILKKKMESLFTRGSFDIFVNYKKNVQKQTEINLDLDKIKNYIEGIKELCDIDGVEINIQPTEFLRSDFYKEDEDKDIQLIELLGPAFDTAIKDLVVSREEEGQKLIETLKKHQSEFEGHFLKLTPLKESYQVNVREKLLKRFKEESVPIAIDDSRFLQEIIYYLEKLDIDEEINRISIHLEKLTSLLLSHDEVGRQIDFLIQELNRETNTIGSKSGNHEISEHVVQMKVQLEKIREQALNLQ